MRITISRKRRVEPEGKIIVTYYMTTMNSMYYEHLLKTILTGRGRKKLNSCLAKGEAKK